MTIPQQRLLKIDWGNGSTVKRQIICIFCGNKADFLKRNGNYVVLCSHCNRETERVAYQKMFDKWLDETLKEENMKLPKTSYH